jgi:hypothetical protein
MRTNVDSALVTYLNAAALASVGNACAVIDLFTITLVGGTILRLASWDQDIVWGGHTFSSAWPYVNRSKLRMAVGLEPSEMDLSIFAPPQAEIGTYTVLAAIAQGQFDGAAVQVDRLYLNSAFAPIGAIYKWFLGQVADISELDRAHAVLTCKDKLELLNTNVPRNLYGPGCRHTLGDAGCGVNLATYTVASTVATTPASNASVIQTNLSVSSYPGPLPTPVSGPTLNSVHPTATGHNLYAPVTYYARVTYTGPNGESLPGPTSAIYITSGAYYIQATFNIPTPMLSLGVSGWNLYVAAVAGLLPNPPYISDYAWSPESPSGNEQLQNSAPFSSGARWTEPGSGLVQGQPVPSVATSGYFALGTIKFNDAAHGGGVNAGISRFISGYDGSISVLPPLPGVPAAGDAFTVCPGCPKTWNACAGKFTAVNPAPVGNTTFYGGTDFIPRPEMGSA